jgi:hypothetical protein
MRTFLSWSNSIRQGEMRPAAYSSFRPNSARRLDASAWVKPNGDDFSFEKTASQDSADQREDVSSTGDVARSEFGQDVEVSPEIY